MTNNTDFSQDAIINRWQDKALRLDPDGGIEKYFSPHYSSWKLFEITSSIPKRFVAVIFADVDECSKCNKEFNWENPEQIAFLPQLEAYAGEPMPEDEKDLLFLDNESLAETVICRDCMHRMLKRYFSLKCAARAARRRERLEKEQRELEANRIEKLIQDVSKNAWHFSDGDDDDGGRSLIEYVCNRFVSYSALADIEEKFFDFDDLLQRAFSKRDLYFYLYENRNENFRESFWEDVLTKFS